ncbi:CP2G1 protein, partial [Nothoprocta pentlandii]|nr:CP2G1 protein [Nothoprocta pentlandii]
NVICSIVFGNRFDYEDTEFQEMMQVMNESFREFSSTSAQFYDMSDGLFALLPGPHRRLEQLLGRMRRFIARHVQQHRATLDPAAPRDFIDCFLLQMDKEKDKAGSEFNEKNLELTTLNLFFAGTETVSSTLRYGFLLLMKHPEVQGGRRRRGHGGSAG